jgi:hypothetical protein
MPDEAEEPTEAPEPPAGDKYVGARNDQGQADGQGVLKMVSGEIVRGCLEHGRERFFASLFTVRSAHRSATRVCAP